MFQNFSVKLVAVLLYNLILTCKTALSRNKLINFEIFFKKTLKSLYPAFDFH